MPFRKEFVPQFYNASTGTLSASSDNAPHYRLTLLYFQNGKLTF